MPATLVKRETKREEIIVYGFLRDIMKEQADYNILLEIIITYFIDRYANFYDHSPDSIYTEDQLHLGDIIKISATKYEIVDIDGNKIYIGKQIIRKKMGSKKKIRVQLSIPYEICKYLYNAPEFFSKLNEMPEFKSLSSFTKSLMLKYDDRYLIDTFGGALNAKYKEIQFMDNKDPTKSPTIRIVFENGHITMLTLSERTWTYKDIEELNKTE